MFIQDINSILFVGNCPDFQLIRGYEGKDLHFKGSKQLGVLWPSVSVRRHMWITRAPLKPKLVATAGSVHPVQSSGVGSGRESGKDGSLQFWGGLALARWCTVPHPHYRKMCSFRRDPETRATGMLLYLPRPARVQVRSVDDVFPLNSIQT